jgi:hypothetical protein
LLQNADHAWLTTFTSGESPSETSLPWIFAHGWGAVSCETHHSCAQGLMAKYKSGAGAWQDWFQANTPCGPKGKGCENLRSLLLRLF